MKKPLIVGYLQSWSSPGVTFTKAAEMGYTGLVLAFGTITGTEVGIYDDAFLASPTPEALKKDISDAKQAGAIEVLLSVGGGENNTYNPDGAYVDELASNILKFLDEYGFTGIDFDLEIDGDGAYLNNLCTALRQQRQDVTITSAPQLNMGAAGTDVYPVSTANVTMYDDALKNQQFDYVFIQCYNNEWPEVDGAKENNVEFISKGFINLKNTIPASTLITIGQPANKHGAGFSIFKGVSHPEQVYAQLPVQYGKISDDPQFGGAMVWSVNLDEDDNYLFVTALKGAID
ncbi:glycosyl hydrolase family 18 protein [Marinibactrum halimedae]|uniref:GH18 domain-containing protein n=1 Tax=Marinibactrum halimedae TaxID=1444977 RepID=A0AA37T8H5_9GAMM|nr:glycosyl hydrolase family 18 protein [Marinibactrum halimedae]MCD9461176.1 glycosyl hydrolase family 18 protein [Marinibactrum halimedae]GLS24612.1 hypothetical protein GCM10007877_03260 [Marinibactrum halimedae]